tara:strand:+ start:649 stop:1779 length:1131 start_codon:yes stop_codon:yes gene_type:complete
MKHPIYFPWSINRFVDLQECNNLRDFDTKFWTGASAISHARYGEDISPLEIYKDTDFVQTPELGADVGSFSYVTDLRSIEILNHARKEDKKVIVFWSGGIDSTVILSSIIKLWSKEDQQRVIVYLNDYSIIENPVFFYKHINNVLEFLIYNDKKLSPELLDNHIICDGEPADKLWLVEVALAYAQKYGTDKLNEKWPNDWFVDFLNFKISNLSIEDCRKIMDRIDVNINSLNTELIKTTGDVFSWINFNFHYSSHVWARYSTIFADSGNAKSIDKYKKSYFPWFNSKQYQQWAWSNSGKKAKRLTNLQDYKSDAKEYIYDLTKDVNLLKFQTKMGSRRHSGWEKVDYVVYNNGECVAINDSNGVELFQSIIKLTPI